MIADLRSCPRCRGSAVIDRLTQYAPRILCTKCGYDWLFQQWDNGLEKAIKRWNEIYVD